MSQNNPRVTYPANPHDIIGKALAEAESFMSGFEGDDTQNPPVNVDVIRDAQAVWDAAPGLLAAYPPEHDASSLEAALAELLRCAAIPESWAKRAREALAAYRDQPSASTSA